jgi:hypothetical protein
MLNAFLSSTYENTNLRADIGVDGTGTPGSVSLVAHRLVPV